MVCLPRTVEVLVAVTKEMAEGFMDCTACSLAGYAYFIAYQQAKDFCTRGSDTDSFDYSIDGASELFRLTLNQSVPYDYQHSSDSSTYPDSPASKTDEKKGYIQDQERIRMDQE